jgi:hypothetical protein
MPDYALGKIYKITSPLTEVVNIGSTCAPALSHRLRQHNANYNQWKRGGKSFCSSYCILDLGEYQIELMKKVPCSNKDELRAHEQQAINETFNCNQRKALLTAEDIKMRKAAFYQANIEKIKVKDKQYRDTHKTEISERGKTYYEKNAESIRAKVAEYRASKLKEATF